MTTPEATRSQDPGQARKCLIVQPIHEQGLALLREAGLEPVLSPAPDMKTVAAHAGDCIAVITRNAGFSAEAIAAAPHLKVISVHGTGHNAVDKTAAAARNIPVCNVPGANARSVAELALGLALAAARGIVSGDAAERAGRAGGFRESARFSELQGKTALIIGWGAIGSELGRMLDLAFGMEVLVHSPRARDTGSYARTGLEEGLARADLVSLHTPMRPETRHMMNAARFAAMKPGAIFVNTAREGLVDEAALAAALSSGQLAAAGLDVYEDEAPSGPLADLPVIFTPHMGATTEEALIRVALRAAENVTAVLAGRRPETTVNAALLKDPAA